ncbi:MAG: PASTA domain-containing protein, partial [Eubacterium sp.]|nr:PASTA domain-containing protein [Eubacterium sp.]
YPDGEGSSSSSSVVYVPNLKGMTYKQAMKTLTKAGLRYQVSPEPEDDDTSFEIVEQYPEAGSSLVKGDTVFLYRE